MTAEIAKAAIQAAVMGTKPPLVATQPNNPWILTPAVVLLGLQVIIILGVLARIYVKGIPDRMKAGAELERVRQDGEKTTLDTLLTQLRILGERVTDLEKQVVDERKSCADQIRVIEQRHDTRVAALEGELKGMRDNMIQRSRSAGSAIALGINSPTMINKIMDDLGDVE